MGLLRTVYYTLLGTYGIYLLLINVPNLLEIDPQQYTPVLLNYEGALAVNNDLEDGEIILEKVVLGPESIVFKDGGLYTSLLDGRIVFSKDEKTIKVIADTSKNSPTKSGRPAGLRILNDDLYVADVKRGLLKVNLKTGKVTDLVRASEVVGGIKLGIANDLDIDDDGIIYFSDFNTKWSPKMIFFSILEHGSTGRVLTYNTKTGKSGVLLENMYSPNGIQLAHDKKSLLISEFTNNRILRYHLNGPKKGETEIFAQLPGEPDNIRLSSGGGYWVATMTSRSATSPQLVDRLGHFPGVRKALARITHGIGSLLLKIHDIWPAPWLESTAELLQTGGLMMYGLWSFDRSVIVELGADGTILRSLHSNNPKISLLSQCTEHEGKLYIGSFLHPHIIKIEL